MSYKVYEECKNNDEVQNAIDNIGTLRCYVINVIDRATSLCNLLHSNKDHVKNEEHFEKFEIERNGLSTIEMPMLNTRFFGPIDTIIKDFLIPIMLGKQRSQMNQSAETDNEEMNIGIRE
ncbi:hypothetical protein RhiirA4_460218 [Rhizophagus irregularis]|uniref:Uncharacterized protein n=1 Tax=Rhizophagus irregularis TaxID=588596 RepID=A0A2I1GG38_9GLOM|nr:hypothetical protein RhiirA4_460218 [Rhizophagus irregularis]